MKKNWDRHRYDETVLKFGFFVSEEKNSLHSRKSKLKSWNSDQIFKFKAVTFLKNHKISLIKKITKMKIISVGLNRRQKSKLDCHQNSLPRSYQFKNNVLFDWCHLGIEFRGSARLPIKPYCHSTLELNIYWARNILSSVYTEQGIRSLWGAQARVIARRIKP